jgi:hypothetical protein
MIKLTNTTNALPYGRANLADGMQNNSAPIADAGLATLERVQNNLTLGRWP